MKALRLARGLLNDNVLDKTVIIKTHLPDGEIKFFKVDLGLSAMIYGDVVLLEGHEEVFTCGYCDKFTTRYQRKGDACVCPCKSK